MLKKILLLLLLLPSAAIADENVVVVWDGSGSMDGRMDNGKSRMDNAKDALKSVLLKLPDRGVNVGIVVFEAAGIEDEWIYPLGPIDKEKLTAAINKPSPGGGTPLADWMKIGVDALLKKRTKREGVDTYKLLIVTDGQAGFNQPVKEYAVEILMQGVAINCIGLDMSSSHELASLAVNNANMTYVDAKDVGALQNSIAQVFSEVNPDNPDIANEVFEDLATIPDDLAIAMIDAMSKSGTIPIGERPEIKIDESGNVAVQPQEGGIGGIGKIILIVLMVVALVFALIFAISFIR